MVKPSKPPASQPPEAELKRREMQRAKQAEARAARAQGLAFVPAKKKRKPLERRRELQRKAQRAAVRNAARRSAQKAVKAAKATAPTVIVVPIYWKGQAGQMGQVLSVCTDAEQILKDAGWQVQTDGGHKYTPGQKFAYWEHRGVKLRVEVGPKEAMKGNCTLACTRSPGVPAERLNGVAVKAEILPSELSKLKAQLEVELTHSPAEDKEESVEAEPDIIESKEPPTSTETTKRSVRKSTKVTRSGDDLEDDFDLSTSVEPQPKKSRKSR